MRRSSQIIIFAFLLFCISIVSAESDVCYVEGKWANTTSVTLSNITSTVEQTIEFSETSEGTNSTQGTVNYSAKLTTNGCTCSYDNVGSYNYSTTTQTAHITDFVCSNNKTSGDCDPSITCNCETNLENYPFIITYWSSDCDSFMSGGIEYVKQSSDWWVWSLIIAAVLVVVLVLLFVIAVGGYMYYRKRMQYSSYN